MCKNHTSVRSDEISVCSVGGDSFFQRYLFRVVPATLLLTISRLEDNPSGAMPYTGVEPLTDPSPPGYNPDDKYKDPVLYYKHKEAVVAEEYVKMAEAKMMQKELAQCYKNSGVNFVTECKEKAEAYMKHIEGLGVSRSNIKPTDKVTWG
jgi:NADH dehydrogenase (ubiquinone) 1 beta subcomplex subunit 10